MKNNISAQSEEKIAINEGEEHLRNKKFLTLTDVKDEILKDNGGSREDTGSPLSGTIAIWAFSILLFATGLFVLVTTSLTVFGIVVGIIMMAAAVYIPFATRAKWMKSNISDE